MAKANGGKQAAAPPAKEEQRQRPAHECRLGRIKATCWRNETKEGTVWYSVTVSRTYKDGAGQYKSASSYGRDDLLVVAEVCRLAYLWIHAQGQKPANDGAENGEAGSNVGDVEIPF